MHGSTSIGGHIVKRTLILGVAALVLAVLAPSIGTQGVFGTAVAQAGTSVTDPAAPVDPNADPNADPNVDPNADPNAPDQNTGDESQCPGAAGAGAHASGEDCPVTPPPATPTPAPVTPTPTAPAPKKHTRKKSGGGSGVAGKSQQRAALPVVEHTTTPVVDTDTGTVPQGGIQAGAGGTAGDGTVAALLLGSGALALMLMAGGLALRRRGFES
jgi:hypothetical protein